MRRPAGRSHGARGPPAPLAAAGCSAAPARTATAAHAPARRSVSGSPPEVPSPCASIIASTISEIASGERVADALGSRGRRGRRARGRLRAPPARSARTRSGRCGSGPRAGAAALPTAVGCTPFPSTRHGTSTHAPCGRFEIRPLFRHVPVDTLGSPVAIEWTISEAYSRLRSISNGPPAASVCRIDSYSRRFSSLRRTYSSTGTRKRSIISSLRMNHGRYSAECSLDSVGKYPSRRYISTRTRRRSSGSPSMASSSSG